MYVHVYITQHKLAEWVWNLKRLAFLVSVITITLEFKPLYKSNILYNKHKVAVFYG